MRFHIDIRCILFIYRPGTICRAEECFKCAIEVDPQDVEALGLYADFFWHVRNDHWRAEEMYLQAITSDSKKSFPTLKYANFLWSTGGEGTCLAFDASK